MAMSIMVARRHVQTSASAASKTGRRFISSMQTPDPAKHCAELVRRHDYEGYLSTIFMPSTARDAAWAVRALNVETALISDAAKDPTIGRLRMQWWRDAIDKTFQGSPPNHPALLLLAKSLESKRLSQMWFRRILKAREEYIHERQFTTLTELEEYAENTTSSVLYLLLETLGATSSHTEHAASHAGRSIGISTALRATPHHVSKGRLNLPAEIMAKHSLSTEDVLRHGPSQRLADTVFEIATRANDQLLTARSFAKDVPKSAAPALLPLICCESYLTSLQRINFDPFATSLQKRTLALPFRLWRHAWRGTY